MIDFSPPMPDDERIPVLLTREQAADALETMERLLIAAAKTAYEMPNIAMHFTHDLEVFRTIAEQLRAAQEGRGG